MPQKKEKFTVIYPEYFMARNTKAEGRRVPKKLARATITVEDIERAVKSLGMNPVVEKDKSYPRFWFKNRGRVLVSSTMAKTELLKKIGEVLPK